MVNSRILEKSYCLEDDTIADFHAILAKKHSFCPRNALLSQAPQLLEPLDRESEHLQIIYRGSKHLIYEKENIGHWTCVHYVGGRLFLYDSIYRTLTKSQLEFIDNMFPWRPPIYYRSVQKQRRPNDCGLYAIAYATSIVLKQDPNLAIYDDKAMRPHLMKILTNETLELFPTKVRCNMSRTVRKARYSRIELQRYNNLRGLYHPPLPRGLVHYPESSSSESSMASVIEVKSAPQAVTSPNDQSISSTNATFNSDTPTITCCDIQFASHNRCAKMYTVALNYCRAKWETYCGAPQDDPASEVEV